MCVYPRENVLVGRSIFPLDMQLVVSYCFILARNNGVHSSQEKRIAFRQRQTSRQNTFWCNFYS